MGYEEFKDKTYEERVEEFIRLMNNRPLDSQGKSVSNAECAVQAGWSVNRSYKTASELLKKPEILKRVRQLEEATRIAEAQTDGSVHSILDANINKAVLELANSIKDSRSANEFIKAYGSLKKQKIDLEGDWDGASIGEIAGELDNAIKEAQELKQRIEETIRAGEVQK